MPSLSYKPERRDVVAASRLHHLATVAGWRVAAALFGYGAFAFGVVRLEGGPTDVALLLATAAVAVILLALAVAQLVRPRLVGWRQFREQRILRDPHTLDWSEEGYAVRGPNVSSDLPWGHYLFWREDARVILLYQSRLLYQFVPKRVLPPGAAEFIRGRLRSAGVPRARRFLS